MWCKQMKFRKSEENYLSNSLKNMGINSRRKRRILRNIESGAKLLNNANNNIIALSDKSSRPFSLNILRKCRFGAQQDADNCSPTRAYHSDSETVVRKDKETAYRSQSNLNCDIDINRVIVCLNPTRSTEEQADYLSSESAYQIPRDVSRCISTGIYDTTHSQIQMKRFSLRESSTSLFSSNIFDPNKLTNVERSPSLQHILCSSIDASPCFRTPMSIISGNCDQLTATTSSCVSCSSGYSHSGIFNTGYSSDDFHLLQSQRITNNECTAIKKESHSTSINNDYSRTNSAFQPPHFLSSDVDLSRQQIPNPSSCDSSATMDDLSSYMDLMIHIPKMYI